MDSQPRVFETSLEAPLGTPLSCYRPMRPQPIVVWTPYRIVGALFMALLSVPRAALLAPAVINRNRRA